MTGGQDQPEDVIRQRLAEIQQRADRAPEWTGGPDWTFHALNDRARLVAALTAVLDLHKPERPIYTPPYGSNADVRVHGKRCVTCYNGYRHEDKWPCSTYRVVAAALEEQP